MKTFLTSIAEDLKNIWARGIEYSFRVTCPCGKGDSHTLNLEDCLTRAAIPCSQGARILTAEIQSKFMDKSKDNNGRNCHHVMFFLQILNSYKHFAVPYNYILHCVSQKEANTNVTANFIKIRTLPINTNNKCGLDFQ